MVEKMLDLQHCAASSWRTNRELNGMVGAQARKAELPGVSPRAARYFCSSSDVSTMARALWGTLFVDGTAWRSSTEGIFAARW